MNQIPDIRRRRIDFNIKLSSARQAIEHVFGRLKSRFPILKSLPGYKMDTIFKFIEALFVLHNILIEFGDKNEFDEEEEEDNTRDRELNDEWCEELDELQRTGDTGDDFIPTELKAAGEQRRQEIMAEVEMLL
jgi:hypothetical protein